MILAFTILLTLATSIASAPATASVAISIRAEEDRIAANQREMCIYFSEEGSVWTSSCWPYDGRIQTRPTIKNIPAGEHVIFATVRTKDGMEVSNKVTMTVLEGMGGR